MALYTSVYCAVRGLCTHTRLQKTNCKPLPILLPCRGLFTKWLQDKVCVSKLVRPKMYITQHQKLPISTVRSLRLPQLITGNRVSTTRTSVFLPLSLPACRLFHTSQPQRAIPPVVWVVLRPFINIAAIIFGRLFRKFWRRLPQEKRDRIILRLKSNKRKIYGVLGTLSFGLLLYVLAHIEEVPYTKRKRFILFSRQDMRNLCEHVQDEMLLSSETSLLPNHHPLYHRIVRVMHRIMEANREAIVESGVTSWKIFVIDEPEINNAMVLPNGTVFIFSGIMETCSGDDQLGAVLAHEIAHVLLNHQGETLSKEHFVSLFFVLIITAIWAVLPDFAAFLSHIFATKTSDLIIRLPFSRLMETEADSVGLNLAAKACLDVREASVFWAKMALREELGCEEKPLEFLSSHPSHESRQKALDELIPEALKLRQSCKCHSLEPLDPRAKFNIRKLHLKEAQSKGCFSCKSIFSAYDV